MTLACIRRPISEARPAARKASEITYTPPWKYRTTSRGSIPSIAISAVGTPPSSAAVTVTSAGSGCADAVSRNCRRCSSTLLSTVNAACRRIASTVARCSVLTEDLLVRLGPSLPAGRVRSHHRITVNRAIGLVPSHRGHHPASSGRPVLGERGDLKLVCRGARVLVGQEEDGIGDPA